jgi:hypothetical protein
MKNIVLSRKMTRDKITGLIDVKWIGKTQSQSTIYYGNLTSYALLEFKLGLSDSVFY